jgi:hypothetical protein
MSKRYKDESIAYVSDHMTYCLMGGQHVFLNLKYPMRKMTYFLI